MFLLMIVRLLLLRSSVEIIHWLGGLPSEDVLAVVHRSAERWLLLLSSSELGWRGLINWRRIRVYSPVNLRSIRGGLFGSRFHIQ